MTFHLCPYLSQGHESWLEAVLSLGLCQSSLWGYLSEPWALKRESINLVAFTFGTLASLKSNPQIQGPVKIIQLCRWHPRSWGGVGCRSKGREVGMFLVTHQLWLSTLSRTPRAYLAVSYRISKARPLVVCNSLNSAVAWGRRRHLFVWEGQGIWGLNVLKAFKPFFLFTTYLYLQPNQFSCWNLFIAGCPFKSVASSPLH